MEYKNTRQIYKEKMSEVHPPEDFLSAFEDNTAIVFELKKERNPSDKRKLLSGIWDINPEAIITEADLCVISVESTAHRKQILIIDKGGDKDTGNRILNLIYKSGVVPFCYVTFKEKKNGIKRQTTLQTPCARAITSSFTSSCVKRWANCSAKRRSVSARLRGSNVAGNSSRVKGLGR